MDMKEAYDMVNIDRMLTLHEEKIDLMWKVLNMNDIVREMQRRQEQQVEKINLDLKDVKPITETKKEENPFIVPNSPADYIAKTMAKLK